MDQREPDFKPESGDVRYDAHARRGGEKARAGVQQGARTLATRYARMMPIKDVIGWLLEPDP